AVRRPSVRRNHLWLTDTALQDTKARMSPLRASAACAGVLSFAFFAACSGKEVDPGSTPVGGSGMAQAGSMFQGQAGAATPNGSSGSASMPHGGATGAGGNGAGGNATAGANNAAGSATGGAGNTGGDGNTGGYIAGQRRLRAGRHTTRSPHQDHDVSHGAHPWP